MKSRVISAIIGSVIVALILLAGGPIYYFGIMIAALIAYNEMLKTFSVNRPSLFIIISNFLVVGAFIIRYIHIPIELGTYYMASIFLLLSIMVLKENVDINDVVHSAFGLSYPVLPLILLAEFGMNATMNMLFFILLILINTWSTDTFAFVVGICFGKHRLCPTISPKKTVEGSIGGFIGACACSILTGYIYNHYFLLNIELYHFVLLGLIGGIFGQIGDLMASRIKRYYHIKDFGKIMPGHGGLMDRIDSLLIVAFASIIYIEAFIL